MSKRVAPSVGYGGPVPHLHIHVIIIIIAFIIIIFSALYLYSISKHNVQLRTFQHSIHDRQNLV